MFTRRSVTLPEGRVCGNRGRTGRPRNYRETAGEISVGVAETDHLDIVYHAVKLVVHSLSL